MATINTTPILNQSIEAQTSTISSRYFAFTSLNASNKYQISIEHWFLEGIGELVLSLYSMALSTLTMDKSITNRIYF